MPGTDVDGTFRLRMMKYPSTTPWHRIGKGRNSRFRNRDDLSAQVSKPHSLQVSYMPLLCTTISDVSYMAPQVEVSDLYTIPSSYLAVVLGVPGGAGSITAGVLGEGIDSSPFSAAVTL